MPRASCVVARYIGRSSWPLECIIDRESKRLTNLHSLHYGDRIAEGALIGRSLWLQLHQRKDLYRKSTTSRRQGSLWVVPVAGSGQTDRHDWFCMFSSINARRWISHEVCVRRASNRPDSWSTYSRISHWDFLIHTFHNGTVWAIDIYIVISSASPGLHTNSIKLRRPSKDGRMQDFE